MNYRGSIIILICILLVLPPSVTGSAVAESVEAETVEAESVKAAFVFNFARYTQWPETPDGQAPQGAMEMCVVGGDSMANAFEKLDGKAIGERSVRVREVGDTMNFDGCKVVFVSSEVNHAKLLRIFAALRGKNALTVGDANNFASIGGVIGLVADNGRLRFEINLANARWQNLAISSRLLKLATILEGP